MRPLILLPLLLMACGPAPTQKSTPPIDPKGKARFTLDQATIDHEITQEYLQGEWFV